MNSLRRTFILAGFAALSGCATRTYVNDQVASSGVKLRGQRIYIYSFLDVRQQELGQKMIEALHEQLNVRLAETGVTSKLIEFRRTEVGMTFATINQAAAIPLKETLERNLAAEREFNPNYRILIFPKSVTVSGSGNFFSIDWRIVDVKTNKEVWSMTSRGNHMKLYFLGDEFPSDRARDLVDGLFKELSSRGLLI